MNFDDTERLLTKFKTRPTKTALVFVILFLLVAAIAYVSGFFGEKGKQHSLSPASTSQSITAAPGNKTQKEKVSEDGVKINQRTQGDQSPAIVSGGNVTIQYDKNKNKSNKE